MQRFRFLPVVVATSLGCGALLAHGTNDTPAQAAARAALDQEMNQMDKELPPGSSNSVSMPATPSVPLASQSPPVAPSAPPPITMPTPQFSTNIPMDTATESKTAPGGMSQKNAGALSVPPSVLNTNETAITVPPSMLNTNETEQYPVNPPMTPMAPPQAEAPSTPQVTPQQPAAEQPNPAAQQPPSVLVTAPGSSLKGEPRMTNAAPNLETLPAPPLPISQQQQAELQNLLSQYLSNQITPAQYQEQRAKILSQQ